MEAQAPKRKKRVNPIVKIAFVCILLVLLIVCVKLNMLINDFKYEIVRKQGEIEKLLQENERTENEVRTFELNEETIKKIAREKLGLRDNDTIIFENSQPN